VTQLRLERLQFFLSISYSKKEQTVSTAYSLISISEDSTSDPVSTLQPILEPHFRFSARNSVCLNSSVGIVTRYGLDGPGIDSRWGRNFPHRSIPVLRPTQPHIKWVPGLALGVKRQLRGVNHPPPSSVEIKERVELYLHSPSGSSCYDLE
jgi:hypothetical protein